MTAAWGRVLGLTDHCGLPFRSNDGSGRLAPCARIHAAKASHAWVRWAPVTGAGELTAAARLVLPATRGAESDEPQAAAARRTAAAASEVRMTMRRSLADGPGADRQGSFSV